jgi:hypothetical protein
MAKKSKQVQEASAANRSARNEPSTGAGPVRRAQRRPDLVRQRKDQRKQQFETQQRQWLYTKIGLGALAAVFVGVAIWFGFQRYQEWMVSRDVDAYFSADDFVGSHLEDVPLLYEQIPPTGGVHRGVWQNCGFYDTFIANENGVHSLEHGAVWITYDPDLPQDDIDDLESKAEEQFVLVSPYPGMDAPVVASVWGKQILLDGVHDDRLDPFIRQYKKNVNNSPEVNGICWSGVGLTTDNVPQQEPYIRTEGTDPVGGISATDATATAAALLLSAATPAASPVATPEASPEATPGSSPVG